MNSVHQSLKPIRSFARRGGRLTRGQRRALDQHWPRYGLSLGDDAETLDFYRIFNRLAPTIMEVGFGDGEALFAVAQKNPQNNYIGVEVHRPGVGHLVLRLHQYNLTNVKVFCEDAIDVLNNAVRDASLTELCLFFPDPWPRKKHHKRRIVQPPFIDLVARKLKPGGVFHYATDWQEYADEALARLDASSNLVNRAGTGIFSPRPEHRPETRFEKRGRRLGHGVWDIIMEKPA